jgi:putative endonuclease
MSRTRRTLAAFLPIKSNVTGFWVYILLCSNGSYYTGYTDNMVKRYRSHVEGTGKCKYTRSFKPIRLAQCWRIDADKAFAMKLEREIKKLTRQKKLALITQPSLLTDDPRVTPGLEWFSKLKD